VAGMTAQPISAPGPEDPAEILALLPERWRAQFASEYRNALDTARESQHWAELLALLHRSRLRAAAYSDPGFDAAIEDGAVQS
jgi:hypothetical protein